jgi:hypothetical protein
MRFRLDTDVICIGYRCISLRITQFCASAVAELNEAEAEETQANLWVDESQW